MTMSEDIDRQYATGELTGEIQEAEERPQLERIKQDLQRLEREGKLTPEKVIRFIELLGQLRDGVLENLTLFYNAPSSKFGAMRGHYVRAFGTMNVYQDMPDRAFMHEVGHHLFEYRGKGFIPPEIKANIELLFHELSLIEKLAVLAERNQGWNTRPNEWFAQAFGTWMNREHGAENIDLPRYECLKQAFESVLAQKVKK